MAKSVTCQECGMVCEPGEYHPYAACLMFKACHNGTTVHAQLEAVREHELEECAKIADARTAEDDAAYKHETDWRMPYAFNRVVRASMDIADKIRARRGRKNP